MITIGAGDFRGVCAALEHTMKQAPVVEQERWQGRDVSGDPAAVVREVQNVVFEVDLPSEDLDYWRRDIEPNLPWADDHFAERVGGEPLNPGVEWQNWPWGRSAAKFRDRDKIFNHTYMERLWPKYARMTTGGRLLGPRGLSWSIQPRMGIAWTYGDLQDLVEYMVREPHTRQAWISLFFPEDTGYGDGGRKPCTLGYQFMMRGDKLSIWYPLRSCDFAHHFRDDCYLAVRLLLWVLDRCRAISGRWASVSLGTYAMHMTSLHIFENDWRALCHRTSSR